MDVEHDQARHRFSVTLPEGRAELRYFVHPDTALDLYHVEADAALRGKGIAGDVTAAAFAYVRANGRKVRASCPFVVGWLARHPEEKDIVV